MASLYGKRVKDTFKSLLKLNDNDIISATEKQITDGLGGSTSVFIDTYGNLRASKYKVTGAGSGAFLKGDGSLDTNAYLTEALAASTYLKITDAAATYLTITNAAATYLPIGADTDDIPEGITNKYFTNARAIGATLTGFTPIIGTVTSADSIKSAIEKIYASLGGGGGGGGDFVPYTGADQNVDLGEFGMLAGFIQFDTTPTGTPTDQGTEYWDEDEETLALVMNGTTGHIMQDMFFNVKNQTGFTIAKGTNVGFAGTLGSSGRLLIQEFTSDGSMPAEYYMGVTNEDILDGANGKVLAFGKIRHIDTSAWPDGTLLYCSDVAGNFTDIKPTSPNLTILVAAVIHSSATVGTIQVRPSYAQKLVDASDVRIADLADEDILQWNETNLSFENINIFTALGATDVGKALLSIPPAGLTIPPTTKPRGIRINVDNTVSALEVGDQGYIPYYDSTDFYINSPIFVDSYGKVIVGGETGFYDFTVIGEAKADNFYVNTFAKIIAETADDSLSFSTYDGVDWIQNLRLYNNGGIKQSAVTNALIGADNTGLLRAGTKADLETILGAPATSGSLTANYVPVATDVDSIVDSMIYQDGTNGIVIGGTSTAYKLQVNGTFGADELNIFGTGKVTANLVSGYITHQVLNGATYNNVLRLHKNQDIQQFKILDGIVYADGSGYLAEATSGQIIAGLGFTPYNSTNPDGFIAPGTFFATSPLSWDLYTNTISMSQASDLNNGWLSASDWTTFNNKGSGSVTSVAMSVPTGLSISGSPITTSGTLAVTFTAGYSIPTNASQSNWDTAYSNRITSASSPLSIASNVISISQANTTTNGYLSSTDWNTFNNKQNALGYTPVPTSRTLTINGTGYDLSADRSWTISGTISGLTSGYLPYANSGSTLANTGLYTDGTDYAIGGTTFYTGMGAPSLSFSGTTNSGGLMFAVGGYVRAFLGHFGDQFEVGTDGWLALSGSYIRFSFGGFERARIAQTTGNFLLGTTTDSGYKLDVNGTGRFSSDVTVGTVLIFASGGYVRSEATYGFIVNDSTNAYNNLILYNNGNAVFRGTVTASNGLLLGGSLTSGYVPKATGTSTLGNSLLYDYGTGIGINTTTSGYTLNVNGTTNLGAAVSLNGVNYLIGSSYFVSSSTAGFAVNNSTDTQNNFISYDNGNAYVRGNFGVGTTSAGGKFEVYVGASGATAVSNGSHFILQNSAAVGMSLLSPDANASRINFGTASNNRNAIIYSDYNAGSQTLAFYVGSGVAAATEKMRITSTGNLLINTTTDAGYKLDVNGTGRFSGNVAINGSASSLDINPTSGQPNITLRSGNTFRGYIEGNSSGGLSFGAGASASIYFTLASSGAATFSSSVTAVSVAAASSGTEQAILQGGYLQFYNAAASNKWIKLTDDASTINAIGFSKSGSVATTWFPSGNVGIGTTSPTSMLTLNGTSPFIRIERSGVPTWQIQNNYLVNQNGFSINNITLGTTPFFIGENGNIGMGTASPGAKIHAYTGSSGNTLPTNAQAIFESDSNGGIAISTPTGNAAGVYFPYSTNAYYTGIDRYLTDMRFLNGGSERMRITSGGNLLVGTTTDLYKLTVNTNTNVNFGVGVTSFTGTDNAVFLSAVNGGAYTSIPMAMNASIIGFYTGFTEAGRIDGSQNWFIGGTGVSGGGKLQVTGDINISGQFKINGSAIGGGVPTSRTITINGVTQDLSADRSWTVSGGGGIGGSGNANEIAYFTSTYNIASLSTGTYPSLTELSYVKGVTSGIQSQINGKVGGSGTSGYVTVFNTSTSIQSSGIYTYTGARTYLVMGGNTAGSSPLTLDDYSEITHNMSSNYTASTFKYSGSAVGSISVGASSTSYNTSSDYRLKTDYKLIDGIGVLNKINVYDFAWISTGERSFGVKAHELQEVIPYAVTGVKDGKDFQSVDYSKIVPVLIQAVKDQQKEIELLKSKINN